MGAVQERLRSYGLGAALALAIVVLAFLYPQYVESLGDAPLVGDFIPGLGSMVIMIVFTMMAVGLNIVVGYAGLLDLGYVAFYAAGAYTSAWFASQQFDQWTFHFGSVGIADTVPGIHLSIWLVILIAGVFTAVTGILIGLPTLRLRGDYLAIVTLGFGEIIGRIAINGDEINIFGGTLTAGRQGITPVDRIDPPGVDRFGAIDLRPWYWFGLLLALLVLFVNFRLRDSRLGRAWIALREDEVAAASMGVPLVKTKLMAYATGAAFGGLAGVFFASYRNTVNADQFQFSFSIFILAMIILGGLGSIWGVVIGAIALTLINNYLIRDVLKDLPSTFGLDFELTELNYGIFGFLLVVMMVLRPEGLLPNRRRQLELHGEDAGTDEGVYEARMP